MPLDYVNVIAKKVIKLVSCSQCNVYYSFEQNTDCVKIFAAKLMCFGSYVRMTVMELCVKMYNKYWNCDFIVSVSLLGEGEMKQSALPAMATVVQACMECTLTGTPHGLFIIFNLIFT
jgi:hypothetical protein